MQTILGANGTIGSVLARELKTYTNKIRLVSRHPKKINDTDELFPADLTDPLQVEKAIAGSSVVYLVAGFEYKLKVWEETWPKLMRACIDACSKHNARFVFFDNVYLYDVNSIGHMTEDSAINAPSQKGKIRQEIAAMLMKAVKVGTITALIARSADFYGPANKNSFLTETVYKNIKQGKRPNWFVNAGKKHSFTYTPDAARATAILGNTADAYNQVWHLPTDKNVLTGIEMINLFNAAMNSSEKPMVIPVWMIKLLGIFMPLMREMPEMMYQYDRDYIFDSGKFEKRFNFVPTSYKDGIQQIVSAG